MRWDARVHQEEDGGTSIAREAVEVSLVKEWRDKMASIRKEIWGRLQSGPKRHS